MRDRYGRIQLLLAQHRYEMAERDLRALLAEDPRDAVALSLLALCLVHDQERLNEATGAAKQAIGFAPDEPLGHYALAVSYLRRNRSSEAVKAIEESLRLDPHDADAFALLSRARLGLERYQQALDAANQGLAIDPEHINCGNMRSIALERLGRGDEAIESASDTLRRDPDDPMSHAAHGFTLLNAGRYQEAQVAFRECLRLDPHNEMARIGMVNALNQRSVIFRLVYRFYVAMSRLNSKAAFALIFGAWLMMQVLGAIADRVVVLRPLIFPILLGYVLFVILTWIAQPLFNTFLRFHPFGQHLLDRSERWASNLIAPCIALSIFSVVDGIASGNGLMGLLATAYWSGMAIPIAATFAMPTPQRRLMLAAATLAVAALPPTGIVRSILANDPSYCYQSFQWFAYSLLAIQIGSTVIASRPVQR